MAVVLSPNVVKLVDYTDDDLSEDEAFNHEAGRDVEEASIYFLVEGDTDYHFYRIPNHPQPLPPSGTNFLDPVFELRNQSVKSPCCAAVGSVIYVYGGGIYNSGSSMIMSNSVNFIDTAHPDKGWVKAKPMENARSQRNGKGFSINNKVYACGGFDQRDHMKVLPMEVYDPADDQWEILGWWETDSRVLDCAVDNERNRVFLYTSDHKLHSYNVEAKKLETCPHPLDYDVLLKTIVVLGNVLYTGGYDFDNGGKFKLTGYDLNKGFSPAPVSGLDKLMEVRSDYRLPRMYVGGYGDLFCPKFRLIPVGKKKMAVVWPLDSGTSSETDIFCLKMEMEEEIVGPGEVRLRAHSGSFSSHKFKGFRVDQVIPV